MTPVVFWVTGTKVKATVILKNKTVADQYLENVWSYSSKTLKAVWSGLVNDHYFYSDHQVKGKRHRGKTVSDQYLVNAWD